MGEKSGLRLRRSKFGVALLFVAALQLGLAPGARALDSDFRTVTHAGLYGLAVGTVAGLVSGAVSGQGRNVLIGSSVGLYLGLAVGIYHLTHRDDPGNPLRYAKSAAAGEVLPARSALPQSPPALVELNFQVASF